MRKEKHVYISGKITGLVFEDALKSFNDAEEAFKIMGFNVVNPMAIEHNHDKSWENYMLYDIKAMLECDHIYMLKNWHESKGANIEYNLAKDLGLKILFQ